MVEAGQPFPIQVRAEDEYYNLATGYAGAVRVCDESGSAVETVSLEEGIGHATLHADAPGPQRFRLDCGTLSGRANPCRVFAELPERRIYWGDIHGHTNISDGLGASAEEYFAFGRDVAGLDVCALTDHGHFDWPQTIAAVKAFYAPGRYVTLLAQEAGAGSDHMNLYFRHGDTPHIASWTKRYDEFQSIVRAQYNEGGEPEVITGPHHFTYHRGDDRYPFGLWDDRIIRFVEVYSSHGTSEYLGNPRPCAGAKDRDKFMQAGLARGRRFGVIASSDNHDSKPGRTIWGHYPGGLVAFCAPELTREAIWNALWDRHTYAASFDRIYMEFTVDDQPMGSEVIAQGPPKIHYYVIGKTDALTAVLLRNNEELRRDAATNGVLEVTIEDAPPAGAAFYYLRVEQENGERAWSSPIWVSHP